MGIKEIEKKKIQDIKKEVASLKVDAEIIELSNFKFLPGLLDTTNDAKRRLSAVEKQIKELMAFRGAKR